MPTFHAPDGASLAYREAGLGAPLVCLPGGPMQDCSYLGDLGGLTQRVRLVLPDPRGTGGSAVPVDPSSYRCDRLVDDVEALRDYLGLERLTLLGHSAGANLAVLYAARFPQRVERLVLAGPSLAAVGLAVTADDRRAVLARRRHEPWFEETSAAFERVNSGRGGEDDWPLLAPLTYGTWDDAAREHKARGDATRNDEAAAVFFADGAFDPDATRAALRELTAPVLVLAGELDANSPPSVVEQLTALFPTATYTCLGGAGHYPWLDDPAAFTAAVASFVG